jgi:cytochrome c-type biogenesis protein CcmH/NrfF
MIQIEGLTPRQHKIADMLWMMNSKADCQRFIASLEPATRRDAETVVEMMICAVCDEVESVAESQQYLAKFRLTK